MQYHSCVCILGLAKPQNWFDPGVGRYCIPLYFVLKCLFGTVTIYSDIFCLKIQNRVSKKKKKLTLIFQYFGSVGKGQTNICFF